MNSSDGSVSKRRIPAAVAERRYQMLIDGQWVDAASRRTFACVDPFTEQVWGQVPRADAEDVDRAVTAARRAFEGEWSSTAPAQRAHLLRRLAGLLEVNKDRLVRQQIFENGKLIREVSVVFDALVGDCYFSAGLAETLHGVSVQASVPNFTTYTRREPIGAVAAITPWNTPLNLLGWKLFPALAAGNTIVVKPSEVTPTSTLLFAELIAEAGFPPGVVNVVTGYGNDAGAALVEHPGVDKIAFTGSTATGAAIAVAAARRHARVSLEMGGKSPNIIFSDANMDGAVNGVMAGVFAASGQSCMAGSRVLIERPVFDRVAEFLVARGGRMIAGDPLDPHTQLGPLASAAQFEKVTGYFELAKQEGLPKLSGGRRIARPGFFVEPTIYGPVDNASTLAREEIFGPVVCLIPFDDEAQAVTIANDTDYGLAAALWTEDLRRAHRLIPRLRAGTVWVNNYRIVGHVLPFGGYKHSGLGREMGIDALHQYTEEKSVWIDTGNRVEFPVGEDE